MNNYRYLSLKSSQLEDENISLMNLNSTLMNKKERLKVEEIDKIQQNTINEMRKISEQWIEPRKEFMWLDLGREISALKVIIKELELELIQKSTLNDKLESSLVKAEERIKEMTEMIKQNSISQNKIELEEIETYIDNKLLIFNSPHYSEKSTVLR